MIYELSELAILLFHCPFLCDHAEGCFSYSTGMKATSQDELELMEEISIEATC